MFVHYLRIQAVCNTLPRFLPLFYNCGGVTFLLYYMFHQPTKPGRSCFGFIELGLVTYPGCLNPTFVQRAPDLHNRP